MVCFCLFIYKLDQFLVLGKTHKVRLDRLNIILLCTFDVDIFGLDVLDIL